MALVYPVILCGGSGTRLWPLSRRSMPKQFLALTGEDSLFQQATLRVSGPNFTDPLVITSNDYRFIAAQQLTDIQIKPGALLLEPSAKNTAPAILAAAEKLYGGDPDAVMLVVPSDHYIPDKTAFTDMVIAARPAAESGSITTFGIHPCRPETGYGYIETGPKIPECDGYAVAAFHEKPDAKTAQNMIAQGGHLWNSGIFLIHCARLLALADEFVPAMLRCVRQSVKHGKADLDFLRLEETSWSEIKAESIDYAIMEQADDLVVFPFAERWSDLGDWQAVMRELSADGRSEKDGNLLIGNARQLDSQSCLVWSENPEQIVTAIGLQDVVVVAMADAVLVIDKAQAQSVKHIVDLLDKQNFSQAYEQPRQFRPWGWFETLVLAEGYQVRRVHLYPETQISMQTHQRRSENWVVTSGVADIQLKDRLVRLEQNDSLDIPAGTTHQLANNADQP